jgi:hypothetical protein
MQLKMMVLRSGRSKFPQLDKTNWQRHLIRYELVTESEELKQKLTTKQEVACLASFRRFQLYGEINKKYELIIVPSNDPFLYSISTGADSDHIFYRYKPEVSHRRHVFNY